MIRFILMIATAYLASIAALILAGVIAANAQTASFTNSKGDFAGSSSTHSNSTGGSTTSFYGPRGNFAGSSITHGNTTTFYGSNGHYQGSVTTTGPARGGRR